jgi:glutathione S-transferase
MLPMEAQQKLRYQYLVQLERDLFSCWCNLVFRPEPRSSTTNIISPAMSRFMDCLDQVNQVLSETDGPWFFDFHLDGLTMIDFIYISHVERILASCAYWKGLDI